MIGFEHYILKLLETRCGCAVVAALLTLVGGLFAFVAVAGYRENLPLYSSRSYIDAIVLETRMTRGMHYIDVSYDVSYCIHVPTARGFVAEEGRLHSVGYAEWVTARDSGHILVAYALEDPSINEPASSVDSNRHGMVWLFCISIVVLVVGAFWLAWTLAKLWCDQDDTHFSLKRSKRMKIRYLKVT